MSSSTYHYARTVDLPMSEAEPRVRETLREQGFGVLTEIDVQATLKKKLDVDFRPYTILGACNPELAKQALDAEPSIGLLLPCNVVVQTTATGVTVTVADPKAMFQVVDNDAVAPVAADAEARLRRVIAALG